jgi:hypothetical protein
LFRIQGNGQIVIPALTTQGIIQNSATGVLSSTKGTANQVLKMNATGTSTEWGPAVVGVTGTAPIVSSGGINPVISISAATTSTPGTMSAADKTKLDGVISSQWTTSGSNIYFNAGKIGIGTANPIGLLDLGTTVANRKIVLYPGADNDHQYSGFGINYGAMRYQIANTEANHTFYAAASATVSNELFRIQGNGQIVIPAFTTQGIVQNSATGVLSSSRGTAGQVLKMNTGGTAAEWGMPTLQEVVASGNSASGRIRNVQNPTDLQDVATKSYVDNNSTTWQVGDFAHGGIVFWVDETGRHGLVCAKNDQSTGVRWYAGTYGNTQAKGDGPFAGEANTRIIIAAHLKIGDDGGNYAARVCNEMETNINGYPYGGWYLPSFEELLMMYENRAIIDATALANGGSAFADGRYWSSTEKSYYDAFVADFLFGYHFFGSKLGAPRVRAVRAF